MTEDSDSEVDYQIGSHDVDTELVKTGDGQEEFIDLEIEAKAVFKRLASDIYESESAGIREPLTNASTAILRAREKFDLPETQGVIEITLRERVGGHELIIQDNGTGITEEELKEVLAVIGRSTNRNREDLSGQFGMGFLALWMLSGLEGGFIMHTHSRKEGADPISGVWKSGGFSRSAPESFESSLTGDQYGTRIEISLKDGLDANNIGRWVSKYAEWCRVPVVYREFTANNREVFNEDYGDKNLETDFDSGYPTLVIDNEHFRAVCSTDANGRVILLDVPVNRNQYKVRGAPFDEIDIRMKKESGVVVDGPNKGLIPVSENEYKEKEDVDKYLPESEVTEQDIVMPGPIGTRDKLASNTEFWSWLEDEFWDVFYDKAEACFASVSTRDEVLELNTPEIILLVKASSNLKTALVPFENNLPNDWNVGVSEEVANTVRTLRRSVDVAPRDTNVSKEGNYNRTLAGKIVGQMNNSRGDIYMGVSLNQKKSEVVWEDDEDNLVVSINGTDEYSEFEEIGWKKLKDIKESKIDEFDVSKATKSKFTARTSPRSSSGTPEHRQLTLHFSSRHSTNVKATVAEIEKKFTKFYENGNSAPPSFGRKNPTRLILFPNDTERSISEHYWLAGDSTAVARCSVSVWEHLKATNGIHHIDKYIQSANEITLKTTNGELQAANLPENTVVHIVDDGAYGLFSQDEHMESVREYLVDEVFTGGYSTPDLSSVVYAPLPKSEYDQIRPALRGETVLLGDISGSYLGDVTKITTDTKLYAYARLSEWRDTTELEFITSSVKSLRDGGYDMIETLASLHDDGVPPNSSRPTTQFEP